MCICEQYSSIKKSFSLQSQCGTIENTVVNHNGMLKKKKKKEKIMVQLGTNKIKLFFYFCLLLLRHMKLKRKKYIYR